MLRVIKLFGVGAALVVLALAAGNSSQVGWAQDCTVVVSPGQSIQNAINNSPQGSVICLTAGTWSAAVSWPNAFIEIRTSVTIIGAGRDSTFILSSKEHEGFGFRISSGSGTTVTIKNLTVGHWWHGFLIWNGNVIIENVRVAYNGGAGIAVEGLCFVWQGQAFCNHPHVWIRYNYIDHNQYGLYVHGAYTIEQCEGNVFKDNVYNSNTKACP